VWIASAPCRACTHARAHARTAGAYNTDAYYQAKDEGFGDVGVGQVRVRARAPWGLSLPELDRWCSWWVLLDCWMMYQ